MSPPNWVCPCGLTTYEVNTPADGAMLATQTIIWFTRNAWKDCKSNNAARYHDSTADKVCFICKTGIEESAYLRQTMFALAD